MNLEAGQNVVYGTSGVCRVDGIEVKSFDGIHKTSIQPFFQVALVEGALSG